MYQEGLEDPFMQRDKGLELHEVGAPTSQLSRCDQSTKRRVLASSDQTGIERKIPSSV